MVASWQLMKWKRMEGSISVLFLRKGKGKVIPLLNYAPLHEDVLGRGGIAPRILNLGDRWR